MTGVTFCFFVDACYSGGFIECCDRHKEKFEGNSVIVYSSSSAHAVTFRIRAPKSDGTRGDIETSMFTQALMSVLDEGETNWQIADMKDIIKSKFHLSLGTVEPRTYGTDCPLLISEVLREPKKFSWYEFDKARFCRGFWNVAKPALFAMTGREIASCPELCTERRFGRHRVTRPAPAAGGLPRLPSTTPAAGRRPGLTSPAPEPVRRPRLTRPVPRSGSNGDEHRKDGLSKSEREMIRRLVIESYFRQVQELIWKYHIMEQIWLLGFDW